MRIITRLEERDNIFTPLQKQIIFNKCYLGKKNKKQQNKFVGIKKKVYLCSRV